MERELSHGWGQWVAALSIFAALEILPPEKIRSPTGGITSKQVKTPWDLALYTKTGIDYLRRNDHSVEGVELLWQTAEPLAEYVDHPRTQPKKTTSEQLWILIDAIRDESIELTDFATEKPHRNDN